MIEPGTTADDCPVQRVDELNTIEREMRRRGYRWTTQRQLIARVALADHSHYSADELLGLCQKVDKSVSRAAVVDDQNPVAQRAISRASSSEVLR